MLIRTQILLEEKQKLALEKLAREHQISMSEIVRLSLPHAVKKIKLLKKRNRKKITQYEALRKWIESAVSGPGDSEYDKYAYDI